MNGFKAIKGKKRGSTKLVNMYEYFDFLKHIKVSCCDCHRVISCYLLTVLSLTTTQPGQISGPPQGHT